MSNIHKCKRISSTGHVTISRICTQMNNTSASDKWRQVNGLKNIAKTQGCFYVQLREISFVKWRRYWETVVTCRWVTYVGVWNRTATKNPKLSFVASGKLKAAPQSGNGSHQQSWIMQSALPRQPLQTDSSSYSGRNDILRYLPSSQTRPLTRCIKLRVAYAPGMPGLFFPPSQVSDDDMHLSTCVTHMTRCMPGSLTSSFLWSPGLGKCS